MVGDKAIFEVLAKGKGQLTFDWYKDGMALRGEKTFGCQFPWSTAFLRLIVGTGCMPANLRWWSFCTHARDHNEHNASSQDITEMARLQLFITLLTPQWLLPVVFFLAV